MLADRFSKSNKEINRIFRRDPGPHHRDSKATASVQPAYTNTNSNSPQYVKLATNKNSVNNTSTGGDGYLEPVQNGSAQSSLQNEIKPVTKSNPNLVEQTGYLEPVLNNLENKQESKIESKENAYVEPVNNDSVKSEPKLSTSSDSSYLEPIVQMNRTDFVIAEEDEEDKNGSYLAPRYGSNASNSSGFSSGSGTNLIKSKTTDKPFYSKIKYMAPAPPPASNKLSAFKSPATINESDV